MEHLEVMLSTRVKTSSVFFSSCTAEGLAHLPWRAVPGVQLLANFENGKLFSSHLTVSENGTRRTRTGTENAEKERFFVVNFKKSAFYSQGVGWLGCFYTDSMSASEGEVGH